MKNTLILAIFLLISACGKVTIKTSSGTTISFDTNPVPAAAADVSECPSDMTFVPASVGIGSYCIDKVANGTLVSHFQATEDCTFAGKRVCSAMQVNHACAIGDVDSTATYWTNDISGQGTYTYVINAGGSTCSSGTNVTSTNTTVKWQYYCCMN